MARKTWYDKGFDDALAGLPADPPWQPGHRDHTSYSEGYADGERQVAQRVEHEDDRSRLPGIKASDVRPGDMLDLYGDAYADPDKDPGEGLEYEYALVEGVRHVRGSVTILTNAVNFTCPDSHEIGYGGRDESWPDMTRDEVARDLHSDGYRHTAGNRYAKLAGKRGMLWAEIRSNEAGEHWPVYLD